MLNEMFVGFYKFVHDITSPQVKHCQIIIAKMWMYEVLHKDFRKLENLEQIPEKLGIDAKPAI